MVSSTVPSINLDANRDETVSNRPRIRPEANPEAAGAGESVGHYLSVTMTDEREMRMVETRDWGRYKDMWARLLEERTALDVDHWNRRIRRAHLDDEQSLRDWLTKQKVTGYAQTLLVMERFGYPDFLLATADELVDRQYADRPQLRPIYDAITLAASGLGEIIIQARKTFVSLVAPRRTFARIQPTTKSRVDLGLRLEKQKPGGRLQPSKIHESMPLQVSLTSPEEVDSEVLGWLQRAYIENS